MTAVCVIAVWCVTNIRIYSFDKGVEALHICGDDDIGGDDSSRDDGVYS